MAEGIEYHVRAILDAAGGRKAQTRMQKFASGWMKSSQKIEGMGRSIAGNTLQTAGLMAKAAGAAALLAGAAGMGGAVVSAVAFNKKLEDTQYAMATTLQLMDHSAATFQKAVNSGLDPGQAAAAQLNANLEAAEGTMDRLFRIAAKSPASFDQATAMFKNMLPGARAVTSDMERIEQLAKNSLALGMVMGGDFETTGSQMSRILTGGAGAEMETWRSALQTPIQQAAASMEGPISKLGNLVGDDLTRAFNRLAPEDRLKLVEAATKKLGVATEAYGTTWAGLSSTIFSDLQLIQKALGKALFGALKGRMKSLVGEGGVLDPEGKTMAKLEGAAAAIGQRFAKTIDGFVAKIGPWIEDVANNWPDIANRFMAAFDRGVRMAKLMLKVAAARAVLGGGMMAAGKAGGIAGSVGKGIGAAHKQIVGLIGKLGTAGPGLAAIGPAIMGISSAALFALPVMLILGAAMMGVFAVVGGAIAWFVSQWDEIVAGFNDGTISLTPLLDALEVAWDGFVKLGNAIFGNTNAASGLSNIVYALTDFVYFLIAAFALGLKTLGAFQFAWNILEMGMKAVYFTIVKVAQGVVWAIGQMIQGVASMLAKISDKAAAPLQAAADSVGGAADAIGAHAKDVGDSMREDAKDATQLWSMADKVLEGQSEGKFRQGFEQITKKAAAAAAGGGAGTGSPDAPGAPRGGNTHIHKMVVNQDLRNQDPDRVIGAFYRAIDSAVTKRTQSTALPAGGT